MEKIEVLLEKLDNRITASLAKRIDTLDDLNEKLEAFGEDYEKNPTDENRKSYNDVIEYFERMELGIIKDLESLIEKIEADELARQAPATPPTPETPKETPIVKVEEKKEGTGVLTLIIGGALLIASFGAINYFRKQ